MTTTAVFAEMLVAGIEAMVWIALIALAIAQPREADIQRLAALKDWVALITAVVLAFAYGLGIVVDRVSDSLFNTLLKAEPKRDSTEHPDPAKRNEAREKEEARIVRLRLHVLARGDKVTDFIEYIRSRIRVARSTTINLALTTVSAEAFLLTCTRASPWQVSASVFALGSLTAVAAFAAFRINRAYDKWVALAGAVGYGKHS
jgi:hypothetical protein